MKHECAIVRDLLALYAEGLVSQETGAFVREHLSGCQACRGELAAMEAPRLAEDTDTAPLRSVQRGLLKRRLQAVLSGVLLLLALAVSAIGALDAPQYFPYTPDLVTVTQEPDGGVVLEFREDVTQIRVFYLPSEQDSGRKWVGVEASTSAWDSIFRDPGEGDNVLRFDQDPGVVLYNANDGTPMEPLYSSLPTGTGAGVVLPRLALGYYVLIALGLLVGCALAGALLPRARLWALRGAMLAGAYLAAHWMVMGVETSTYCLERVFPLIGFLTVLLFSSALLIHNLIRTHGALRRAGR